jgi:hypothetical protein
MNKSVMNCTEYNITKNYCVPRGFFSIAIPFSFTLSLRDSRHLGITYSGISTSDNAKAFLYFIREKIPLQEREYRKQKIRSTIQIVLYRFLCLLM